MMNSHGNEPRQAFLLRCPCKAIDVPCLCCERQLAPVALLADHDLKAIQFGRLSHCKVKQPATGAVSSIFTFIFAEEEEEASQSGGGQGKSQKRLRQKVRPRLMQRRGGHCEYCPNKDFRPYMHQGSTADSLDDAQI